MVNAVPLYFAYAALGWPMLFSEAAAAAGRCLAGCADEMRWSAAGSWVTGAEGVHALDSGSGAKWGRSGLGSLDPCLAADANADAARTEATGRYYASGRPRRKPTLRLCSVYCASQYLGTHTANLLPLCE
jgi:hypothetical protein